MLSSTENSSIQFHPSFLPTPLTLLEFCSCITWHYAFKKFFFSLMWTILKVFIEFLTILLLFFFTVKIPFIFYFYFLELYSHWLLFSLIFIFTLFYFTILYWFCHTLTWIHHGCTWVPKHEPPSHLPLHIISLDHPRALLFIFPFFGHGADMWVLAPWLVITPVLPALEGKIPTTRPPGKSLHWLIDNLFPQPI